MMSRDDERLDRMGNVKSSNVIVNIKIDFLVYMYLHILLLSWK